MYHWILAGWKETFQDGVSLIKHPAQLAKRLYYEHHASAVYGLRSTVKLTKLTTHTGEKRRLVQGFGKYMRFHRIGEKSSVDVKKVVVSNGSIGVPSF